jgi:hypothetical protein
MCYVNRFAETQPRVHVVYYVNVKRRSKRAKRDHKRISFIVF